jgi:outer membrane protein assembly factor BamB
MKSIVMRVTVFCVWLATKADVGADDWPAWGRDASRNAVSPEKNAPIDFQLPEVENGKVIKPGRSIAWQAELGDRTVIAPVVCDGLVWVGTNARQPDDETIPSKDWDGGVLMCFRERDGKLLWKHRTPRANSGDFGRAALGSAPLVEGDRLWYVNNRTEVVCFDIGPIKKGTGEPRGLWKLDMRKELGVFPHLPLMQDGFAASVGGHQDRLYVVTHNGVDENHVRVPSPGAPSLVCLEKTTGKVVWQDNSPGKDILQHQISSPLVAQIKGKTQVIVGQGDGWLRSFDGATGKLIWKCDLNAKDAVWQIGSRSSRLYVVATPILYDSRVYIATGLQAEAGDGPAALYCIDPTKEGDVSRELEAGPNKGKPNPNSAVVWYTPKDVPDDAPRIEVGKKKRDLLRSRDYYFCRSIASCVAHDGLLFAADVCGFLFCFDAKSGKLHWVDDLKSRVFGQPLWVDRKIYVGTEDGDTFIFAHGSEKKRLAKMTADVPIRAANVFANGALYITTEKILFAIRAPQREKDDERRQRKAPDALFVPSPPDVVKRMLELAEVKKDDLVYDLGSGDGRIVIAAAKDYGCKAAGVELDKDLVTKSRARVTAAGVEKLVTIECANLFEADFSQATVVALYLLPTMNQKLVPKLSALKPGARIVAHSFPIPAIKPAKVVKVTSADDDIERNVYLYTIPLQAGK